jgi:hypothetical protein
MRIRISTLPQICRATTHQRETRNGRRCNAGQQRESGLVDWRGADQPGTFPRLEGSLLFRASACNADSMS